MDAPIKEINVPILRPTTYTRVPALRRMAREYYVTLMRRERERARRVINRFADWVMALPRERVRGGVHEVEAPLQGFLRTYRIDGNRGMDQRTFVEHVRARVVAFFARRQRPFQVQLIFTCRYTRRPQVGEKGEEEFPNFYSDVERVMEDTDLDELYDIATRECLEKMDRFQRKGSGWRFEEVVSIHINVDPFDPLRAGSYFPLPYKLANKKAIINVQNEDNECFKWAVTSAIYQTKVHPERMTSKLRENAARLNWDGIKFPTTLNQISRFENQNPYSINVYGWTGTSVYSLRISKKHENKQCINLMLLEKNRNQHYCWIKDTSRLIASQYNSHKGKRFLCKYCCNSFASNKTLETHMEYCSLCKAVKVVMPKEGGEKLCFRNYGRKMRVPFVVYADFECITTHISSCAQSGEQSYTRQYQKHKPCGYSYLIKCFNDELFPPVLKRFTIEEEDTNVAMSFVMSLEEDIVDIYNEFKGKKRMTISEKEQRDFEEATVCHICEGSFGGMKKVRDHCHLTGTYRGAAHNECNLEF